MTSTVRICIAPPTLPGERVHLLTTESWSQIGWAARPDERRSGSLWFDALAATGVNWEANPIVKLDLTRDRAILEARMRSGATRHIIIGNAHYLSKPIRSELVDFADHNNVDATLMYEDGMGTNDKNWGLVDDAHRLGWEQVSVPSSPITLDGTRVSLTRDCYHYAPPETASVSAGGGEFPAMIPTVGFGHFRHFCRTLLHPDEFAAVDREYTTAYQHALATTPTNPSTLAAEAAHLLRVADRNKALTRLRGMQAALFTLGYIWNLDIPTLHAWLEAFTHSDVTDADYARLLQLRDPETAAIGVLASLGHTEQTTTAARLVEGEVSTPAGQVRPTPTAARILRIAAETHSDRQTLVSCSPRVNRQQRQFLAEQFGFPLTVVRGDPQRARPLLQPDSIDLRNYRDQRVQVR